jgi:hypothetical protein
MNWCCVSTERRGQRLDGADQRADASELARASRGHGDAGPVSARDHGAGEGHRYSVAERRRRRDRRYRFVDRHRLSSQCRLIDAEIPNPDHAKVGRNAVAGFKQHEVAGHNVLGGDADPLPIANGRGAGIDHPPDRLERSLGAAFLEIADDCVEQHNGQHHDGVGNFTDSQSKRRGDEQHVDQEVVEL